jgi:membrane protein YdbS with pleckstrin-like domain
MNAKQLKPVTLEKEVDQAIEEARMVLPGIQALFGFQLIAVFNQRFASALTATGQWLHLASIVCIAISIALIMAPAAFHRQACRGFVSDELSNYASRVITIAMIPLMTAIAAEVSIIAWLISHSWTYSNAIAGVLLLIYLWFWFGLPQLWRRRKRLAGSK